MPRSDAWLSLLALCACDASAAPSLDFRLRFANPATAARASSVEVSILAGSCSSRDTVYTEWVTRDSHGAIPPRLASGSYALLGRAVSAQCGLIAYGCVQTTLPAKRGTTVEIVLDDVPEQPVCSGQCADTCAAELDGGSNTQIDESPADASMPPDTTVDGGQELDAGPPAPEAGVDAGPTCDGVIGPNMHCYRFESDRLTFQDAEARCVTWGGHLVSFNDDAEELWVTQQTVALGTFGATTVRFWIGFSDAETETVWTWLDGSAPPSTITFDLKVPLETRFKTTTANPYTHWGPNLPKAGNSEPNNGNGDAPTANPGEDCAESRSDLVSAPAGIITPRPQWDDSLCTATKRFVCERS